MNEIEQLGPYINLMGRPIATNLETLLVFIRNKLISDGVFTAVNCYLGVYPQHLDAAVADQFIVITPDRQVAEQPQMTGEGNYMIFFNGEIILTIYSRLAQDAEDRGDTYLTDPQYGIMPKLTQTIQSLSMYQPMVGANQLLAEPFRIISQDAFKRVTEIPGWGNLITTWDISWQFAINVPIP